MIYAGIGIPYMTGIIQRLVVVFVYTILYAIHFTVRWSTMKQTFLLEWKCSIIWNSNLQLMKSRNIFNDSIGPLKKLHLRSICKQWLWVWKNFNKDFPSIYEDMYVYYGVTGILSYIDGLL